MGERKLKLITKEKQSQKYWLDLEFPTQKVITPSSITDKFSKPKYQ